MELEETKYARHDVHISVLSVYRHEHLWSKTSYLVNTVTAIVSVCRLVYSVCVLTSGCLCSRS